MRYWIEYLMGHSTAYNDFITDLVERETALDTLVSTAVRNSEVEKAKSYAHEANVYANMRKKIQAEFNERTAQATYDQQTNGGS